MLAIMIARNAGLNELGEFGVAFSVYALVTGLTRSAVAESVLTLRSWKSVFERSGRDVSSIATAAGLLVVCVGVVLDLRYLVALGFALPGLALYDYLKVIDMAVGRPKFAMAQECLWILSVVLLIGLANVISVSPFMVFVGWSVAGAAVGIAHALVAGVGVRPGWGANRSEARIAAGFGTDYLVSSGMAQLTPSILAIVVGNAVVGSLRGAATLLGPIALVAATARSLLIPYLVAAQHLDAQAQMRRAGRTTWLLVAAVFPFTIAVAVIPDGVGRMLLGSNWAFAEPLMPALAIELLFAMAGSVPFAGHRASRASGRTLRIRLGLAPVRLGGVVVASIHFGAEGAAYSMAGIAIIGFVIWWISYANLVVRQEGGQP